MTRNFIFLFRYDREAAKSWQSTLKIHNNKVSNLSLGQYRSQVICTSCRNPSVTHDPFWDLSLPLPEDVSVNLQKCLSHFTKEELLEGREMIKYSTCKDSRNAVKKVLIHKQPEILIIRILSEKFFLCG